jgi:signal transduction histidine kinase
LQAFGWGIVNTVLLAAGGGAALGVGFLRRIEAINRTTRSIMEGDLSKRVPTRGGEDEMDQLAINLNAMLDRIQGLMESVKRVSDDIAHDLRTPLSRLRHRLEATRAKLGPDGERDIEQSIAELDAILETFSALLRIAQIESGARQAAFSNVSLGRILSTVFEAYAAVAEDQGQKLEVGVQRDFSISGDRELLTQMVANLVENAIRHCPAGVRISVSLDWTRPRRYCLSRTGPGMPGRSAKIFRRSASSNEPHHPAAALASLVNPVADLHGAAVECTIISRASRQHTVSGRAMGDKSRDFRRTCRRPCRPLRRITFL